jgi:hypothetical protein
LISSLTEYGGTDSEGYKQLQEQIQATARLEKNIALEKERLKILSGKKLFRTQLISLPFFRTKLILMIMYCRTQRRHYRNGFGFIIPGNRIISTL